VSTKEDQIALAAELQTLLLEDYRRALRDGTITPTDRASLARLLSQNGWSLDPSLLGAGGLKGKMPRLVRPEELEEDAA
jgi:hypothetical protein